MSSPQSRQVLDWFREYAETKLTAIGDTVDASNMNLPLTSEQRVDAAVAYLDQRAAELEAGWTVDYNVWWEPAQDQIWNDIHTTMPAAVFADYAGLWADADVDVLHLLKTMLRALNYLVAIWLGGG